MLNLIYNKESYEKYEKIFFESMLEIANFNRDIVLNIIENGEETTINTKANYKSHHDYKSWPPDYNSNWIAKLYLDDDSYDYHLGSCYNDEFRRALIYETPHIDSDIHFILDPNEKDNSSLFFAEDYSSSTIDLLLKIDLSALSEEELFTANDKNTILAISDEETHKEHYYLNLGNIATNSPSYNLRNILSNSKLSLTDKNYVKFESVNLNETSKAKFEKKKAEETEDLEETHSLQLGDFIKDYRAKLIPKETVFDASLSMNEKVEDIHEYEDEILREDLPETENPQRIKDVEVPPHEKKSEIKDIDTFNNKKEESEFIELEEDEIVKDLNQEDIIIKTESKIRSIDADTSTQYLIHHVINLMKTGKPLGTILKTLEIPKSLLDIWHEEGEKGNENFIEFYNQYELSKNKTPHEIKEEEKLRTKLNLKVKSQLEYILEENNINPIDIAESEMINTILQNVSIDNIYSSLEKLEEIGEKQKETHKILKKLNNKQLISLLPEEDVLEYGNRTKNEKIERIMSKTSMKDFENILENLKTIIENIEDTEKFEEKIEMKESDYLNVNKLKEVQSILQDLLEYYNPSDIFTKDDLRDLGFSKFDANHYLWVLKDYNLINYVTKEKLFIKEKAKDFANKDFDALKVRNYSNLEIISSENKNNKLNIIIKGLIDDGDLFNILRKLEECEEDIAKVISDSHENGKINLLIELNVDKEKLEYIKELFNK